MPDRRIGGGGVRVRAAAAGVALGIAALTSTGCSLPAAALDGPIAVDLHISTTSTSVEVDAPGWFAAATRIHLCPMEPPLADLAGATWAPFAAAEDWYVHLLDLDGDRVTAAVRSRFEKPDDVAAF